MNTPQSSKTQGGKGARCHRRWTPILVMLACLMAGRVTAGTLTLTDTPFTQTTQVNLSAEGNLDWAKWGTFSVPDYDHKASVTPLINTYAPIGTGSYGQYSGDLINQSWIDGAVDRAQTKLTTGLWASGPDTGYELTIPASTTSLVLNLYLGSWEKTGQLELSLSDGSAAPITHVVVRGDRWHRFTVAFAADSASQFLTVRYHCIDPGLSYGNVTLLAATLSSAASLPLSVPQPILSSASPLKAGSTFSVQANPTASGATAFAYQWQVDDGGGYVDIPGGTSNPLQLTAAVAGSFNYRVVVTNSVPGGTAATSPPVPLTVTPPTATLAASIEVLPRPIPPDTTLLDVNLTAEGSMDWAYWGLNSSADYDTKANIIGNFTQIGSDAADQFNSGVSFTWTDATTANNPVSAATTGNSLPVGNGFELNIPATTDHRLVHIYVGVNKARLHVEASLSDNSAPLFTDDPATTTGTLRYSIAFNAATTGKTLKVRLTETARAANGGAISLLAASLRSVPALSVSTLLADSGAAVLVNQPIVVSVPPLQPEGAPPFSYQWRRDTGSGFTNVPGATARSLSFTAGGTPGNESCDVVITGSQGSITSAPVVLTRSAATGVLKILAVERSVPGANLTQEGSLDWSHWGFAGPADFDYKADSGTLIGNFIQFGSSSSVYRYGSGVSYRWTDGSPNLAATNSGGVYRYPAPNGFELNVAAAQTNRLLHVYLGSYNAVAHVEAFLSDNSAIKLIDESLPYGGNGRYNIQFAAGTAGQHLVFRLFFDPKYSGGNVTLSAASLQGMPALVVGTPAVGPAGSVPVGSSIALQAQGAGGVPPLHYQWQVDSGGGYVAMLNSDTPSLTSSAGTSLGVMHYRVVVSDISGSVTSAPVALTVTAATSTLIASSVGVDGQVIDLSAEGAIDWRHWGGSGYDQKNPIANQISDYTVIGDEVIHTYGGNGIHCTWTNGTPTLEGDSLEGLYINAAPNGFELTAEAASYERLFNLYCAVYQATMHVEAMMSDNTAPIFVDESFTASGATGRRYSFRYSSPTPGTHLIVRWWDAAGANITLNAASLGYGNIILQAQPAAGGQLRLTWPIGTLLEAPTVTGPWTVNGAASPYTFTPTGAQKYFRALVQ